MSVKNLYVVFLLLIASTIDSNSQSLGVEFYLKCTFVKNSLTFKFNRIFKSVKNIEYNQDLDILYWSDEKINAQFPSNMSISSIVSIAKESRKISVNFDRLTGAAELFGINPQTEQEIKECKSNSNNGEGWYCSYPEVTDSFYSVCKIVKQKF